MVPRLDQRIPFPQPVGRDQPRDVLFRAAAATWRGHVLQRDPLELTKDDAAANLVLRAAKNPAMIGTGGWANQLAATAVDDMLVGLAGPAKAQYTYTALDVPGSLGTLAFGLNEAGQVVGYYRAPGGGGRSAGGNRPAARAGWRRRNGGTAP